MVNSSLLHYKKIISIAVPVILANALLPLQGLIDTAIAGGLPNNAAIAGLGLGTGLFALIYNPCNFLQYATSGLSAQRQTKTLQLTLIIYRALIIALVLATLLFLAKPLIINLAQYYYQSSANAEKLMTDYLHIRFYAVYAELGLYCTIGWFAGQGLGKKIMLQQFILTTSNTLISFSFVYLFHYGYAGIAWGTVIANYIALGVSLVMIVHTIKPEIYFSTAHIATIFDRTSFFYLLRLNRDIFIRTVLLAFTFSWLQRLSSQMDDNTLAANTILMGLLSLSAYALDGIAVAAESLVGGAIVSKNRGHLADIIKQTMITGTIIALVIALIYQLLITHYIHIMTAHQDIYSLAYNYRYWAICLPIAGVWGYLLDGYYFGATRANQLRNSMLCVVAIIFPLSLLLTYAYHNHGIWLSLYIFLLLRAIFLLPNLNNRLLSST